MSTTAISILRLLTEKPPPRWKPNRRAQLSAEQERLLSVLSDEWLEQGLPGGQLLAERLKGTITDARCAELGFETWLGLCALHRLVLFLMPEHVFEELAAAKDEALAFRVVAWLRVERQTSALHALVAERVWRLLREVEADDDAEPLRSEPWTPRFKLGELSVEFGRDDTGDLLGVIALGDAERFEISVDDLDAGPLAALREYRPPPARYLTRETFGDE